MKKLLILLALVSLLPFHASALELSPPEAPDAAQEYMPDDTTSFTEGLYYVVKQAIKQLHPSFAEASQVALTLITTVLLTSILRNFSGSSKYVVDLIASLCISICLVKSANSMVNLGIATVEEISQYGKMLVPVMTAALAAQGGLTTSASLYAGTTLFSAILSVGIKQLIVPLIYIYMVLCIAHGAIGEQTLKALKDLAKWLITWCLKIVLYVFTGYLSITGVISGATDATTLKAAKLAVSSAVPVVGNIISDASETIVLSAGIIKNSIGIYGLLVVAAIWIEPFIRTGAQYLLLKLVAAVCAAIGGKESVCLIDDFAVIMGFLVAMTGTVCLLLLVSTICFLKGVG